MLLVYDEANQRFIFECLYAERMIPKTAGFFWDKGVTKWVTKDVNKALTLAQYADETAHRLLKKEVDKIKDNIEASRATDADINVPAPEGLEYMPFQKAGIAYALQRPKTLIADEMGLGKTIQALGVINARPEIERFLFIVPAIVKLNWLREAQKWLIRDYRIQIVNPDTTIDPKAQGYIVNYDLITEKEKRSEYFNVREVRSSYHPGPGLLRSPKLDTPAGMVDEKSYNRFVSCPFCKYPNTFPKAADPNNCEHYIEHKIVHEGFNSNGKIYNADIAVAAFERYPLFTKTHWDFLVVDECHFVKNPKAKRSKKVYEIADKAAQACFLTGTPIVNRPMELFPIITRLGFKMSYKDFAVRYTNATPGRFGMDTSGSANLGELQNKLRGSIMVRRLKKDVLTELPDKIRQVVTLPPEKYREFLDHESAVEKKNQAALGSIEKLINEARSAADETQYVSQVQKMNQAKMVAFQEISRVRHETAVAKIEDSIQYILETMESVDKLIVFAHHRDVLNAVYQAFKDEAVLITGDTSQVDRQAYVDRFQADEKTRLFIGSIQACGVGITLTAASMVLFLELDWTPAAISQAEDRAHRIGQKDCVLSQYLVVDGSLDSKFAKTLVDKERVAKAALDDLTDEISPVAARTEPEPSITPLPFPEKPYQEPKTDAQGQSNGAAPAFSREEKALILSAVKTIAGACDYAHQLDGQGFSRYDADFGHKLAGQEVLSDRQAAAAKKLLSKYRRQLKPEVYEQIQKTGGAV